LRVSDEKTTASCRETKKTSSQREIARKPEVWGNWSLKIDPDSYLSRYPNGPNADMAREAVRKRREKFRRDYQEAERLVRKAIDILICGLGKGIHQGEEDYNLHKFLEDVLWKSLYPLIRDAGCSVYEDFRRKRLSLRREITKKYGIWVRENGSIGRPRSTRRYPEYWKKKQKPNEYLRSWGRLKAGSQNYHLAKAALVPIEQAMWKELRAIEKDPKEVLAALNSIISDHIYQIFMDQAALIIVYGRYWSCQSGEFFRAKEEWLKSLRLKDSVRIPDRQGAMNGAE